LLWIWSQMACTPAVPLSDLSDLSVLAACCNLAFSYLKTAAMASLQKAGDEQQYLYDFAFGPKAPRDEPSTSVAASDLAVCCMVGDEVLTLQRADSHARKFLQHFSQRGSDIVLVVASRLTQTQVEALLMEHAGAEWSSPEQAQVGSSRASPVRQVVALALDSTGTWRA
jgi:hypothetical protein